MDNEELSASAMDQDFKPLNELESTADKTTVATKTPVSIFQELCTAFVLGSPMYNLISESGEAHLKTFQIALTTYSLGVTEIGEAKTKMEAKHIAAIKMIQRIKNTANSGGDLHEVVLQTLLQCSNWLEQYSNVTKLDNMSPSESKNSAGMLTALALTKNTDLPVYETISQTGPAHNKKFVMTCKMRQHTTQGEGKSKKVAKNIAAEKMLQLIEPELS